MKLQPRTLSLRCKRSFAELPGAFGKYSKSANTNSQFSLAWDYPLGSKLLYSFALRTRTLAGFELPKWTLYRLSIGAESDLRPL